MLFMENTAMPLTAATAVLLVRKIDSASTDRCFLLGAGLGDIAALMVAITDPSFQRKNRLFETLRTQ
jgi:hypothetical protein